MKEFFLQRIKEANSLDELDYIVDQACEKLESNKEYSEVYETALEKARSWAFGNNE